MCAPALLFYGRVPARQCSGKHAARRERCPVSTFLPPLCPQAGRRCFTGRRQRRRGFFILSRPPVGTRDRERLFGAGKPGEARTGAAGAAVSHLKGSRQCRKQKISRGKAGGFPGGRNLGTRDTRCAGTARRLQGCVCLPPANGLIRPLQYLLRACLLFFIPVPYPFFYFLCFFPAASAHDILDTRILMSVCDNLFRSSIGCLPLLFFEQLTDRISVFAKGVSCLHDRHEIFLNHPPARSFLYTKRPLCQCCRHSGLLRDTDEKVACAESGGSAASGKAPEREALTRCAERGGEAAPRLRKPSFVPGAFL